MEMIPGDLSTPPLDSNALYGQFRCVFEQYYNALCNYAFNMLKDRDAAEDIVQDVFVRIWESRKDLLGADSIRFYLYTAVRNNCLTQLNREKRMPTSSLSGDEAGGDALTEWGVSDQINLEPLNYRDLLGKGIEQLPDKCKEVFLLSRMGQFSNLQIAELLEVSIKTVNNQLWKAMKMLRAYTKNIQFWGGLLLVYFFSKP